MKIISRLSRRSVVALIAVAAVVAVAVWAWLRYAARTDIAFVNYQVLTLGEISKANYTSWIRIHELSPDRLSEAGKYDMVFVNGMGLRITAEQREHLIKAANSGTPVLSTAVTSPDNYIVSVDSIDSAALGAYLSGGGRANYRNLLSYVRSNIDGKRLAAPQPGAPAEASVELIYHSDVDHPEREDIGFAGVGEFIGWMSGKGLWRDDAPTVVVCGAMGDPTDLIRRLEETGNNVIAVRDIHSFVRNGHIDSIAPRAIINMAHGRLGDAMVSYLTEANIPLFSPLNVNCDWQEWEADLMGMSGGFMSQSIVTPEIDGAVRPYALFAHRKGADGLPEPFTMPERLEDFVEAVNRQIGLSTTPNSEKKIAVVYFKGPGQNALVASGMEVVPSLYNFLVRLRDEGYRVDGLPSSAEELAAMIQKYGPVFGSYSEGAISDFLTSGNPLLIGRSHYEQWASSTLRPEKYREVCESYGEFPGSFMAVGDTALAVARLQFGNVVILPQPAAGGGDNSFAMIHGTDAAPPHSYIAPYLWMRHGFGADAIVHFGTHGSLEYTPRKQVALSSNDWSDRLIGPMPHLYVYTIANVGEGMIAKRRSYATIQSYLTPPFKESGVRAIYRELTEAIKTYNDHLESGDAAHLASAAAEVRRHTERLGIGRELGLDSLSPDPYTEADVARIEQFAEELASEKITGQLYVMGQPYSEADIAASVRSMAVYPIAYGLLALDKLRGRAAAGVEKHKSVFTAHYLQPASALVDRILADPTSATERLVCSVAGITAAQLKEAHAIDESRNRPTGMMAMMMAMTGRPVNQQRKEDERREKMKAMAKHISPDKALALAKKMGVPASALKSMKAAMKGDTATESPAPKAHMDMSAAGEEYTKEQIAQAEAILGVERAILNVSRYRSALRENPEGELRSLVNALAGGYTPPSPGGDPIVNPNTLPTGRNLYGINAEATPSESAWEKGKQLAENTIRLYRERHNDSLPRKVSYTLWSGEFIETGGATIAQILYMLGVGPVRDAFGRVTDIRLIPSEELGRPRIDVVVQTSGQLRDLAASRLFLINRAVEMAASAGGNEKYDNMVSLGTTEAERRLTDKGLSPREAREVAAYRVFGGLNGSYGTGIQEMIQSSDKWDDESEISDVYLHNMGAFYGSEQDWEKVRDYAFEAALSNTDAVVQPRQSNTWGALSLDHVYEFMGGLNLAVRNVTGKDPDAYLSDYRNHSNMRMQEVKEAIGVESRSTIFNPAYIKERMKGGASSAAELASTVENTFGWNVAKPQAIDNEMWDEIYNVYVDDKFSLGVRDFYEQVNPAAMQEVTATMLESARKGMWDASPEKLTALARLHTELVAKYGASGSQRVTDNSALRDFIASHIDDAAAREYRQDIDRSRHADIFASDNSMVMEKQSVSHNPDITRRTVSTTVSVIITLLVLGGVVMLVRRRRKAIRNNEENWKQL